MEEELTFQEELTIQEVAARTGMSVHTLRYYERAGLLDPVGRATSGHRRYTASDFNWIAFLMRLRTTGMSIRQMQEFSDLRRQGESTLSERLVFLEAHQQQVREHIRELEYHLAMIDVKIQHTRRLLADKTQCAEQDQVSAQHRVPMTTQKNEEEKVSFS
jgi:DNA-binding transcriptional MerR regulator